MNRDTYNRIKPWLTAVVLLIVAIAAYVSINFEYVLGEESVTITTGRGVVIPFADVTEVRYFERLPSLSNRIGTSLGRIRSGTFTVDGVGRGKVYATDSSHPAVIIFTAETFYAITPDDAMSFYEQVKARSGR